MLKESLQVDEQESGSTKSQRKELDKTLPEHKTGKLKYYLFGQATKLYKK
jgi:hypothetical protein